MPTFKTNGLNGRSIIVKPSPVNISRVLVSIYNDNGACMAIELPANTANMLSAALEHEAVNAFANELKLDVINAVAVDQEVQHG